ncbi:hypothetical protein [Streptomyces scopuliridis]|uniref:hypothetical protein n=1 Tax=Streptomyces scopuliridis TaxID=452529 RepID=UPI0036B444C9
MAITPDRPAQIRDQSNADLLQHIADLRDSLEHAARLLAFSAGREAADDPGHSVRLLTAADEMRDVLIRTRPLTRQSPLGGSGGHCHHVGGGSSSLVPA